MKAIPTTETITKEQFRAMQIANARKKAAEVVANYRLISDREIMLEEAGYTIEEVPMGSGGVLQEKTLADGTVRIQIGYAHGRNNYAKAIILKF